MLLFTGEQSAASDNGYNHTGPVAPGGLPPELSGARLSIAGADVACRRGQQDLHHVSMSKQGSQVQRGAMEQALRVGLGQAWRRSYKWAWQPRQHRSFTRLRAQGSCLLRRFLQLLLQMSGKHSTPCVEHSSQTRSHACNQF